MADPKLIEKMYCYAVVDPQDPENREGIISMQGPSGMLPLVGADIARSESLRKFATMIAKETNVTVKLIEFSERNELGIIGPDGIYHDLV